MPLRCCMMHDGFSDDDNFGLDVLLFLYIYCGSIFSAFGAFRRAPSSQPPAMDTLRSVCYSLCLQAEGGKKAEAVATVVAAVDLARVRLPVHAEGGLAEEEEAVEVEIRQQGREMTAEKYVATKTLPAELPAAVSVTSEQHRVSQVGGVG